MDFPSVWIFKSNSENDLLGMFGCACSWFRQQCGFPWICFNWVSWEVNVRQNQDEEQTKWKENELLSGSSGMSSNQWEHSRTRMQCQFRVPALELNWNITERSWCFTELSFLVSFLWLLTANFVRTAQFSACLLFGKICRIMCSYQHCCEFM